MNTETCWTYQGNPITEIEPSVIGFVYVITNLIDGRKYFGKKQATFKKTTYKMVLVKSSGLKKKKKIRSVVPSDWDSYYGSSTELSKDIEILGKENFSREILMFCASLSSMSYQEARIQFVTDALLHPDKYYNAWISCRTRRDHLLKK